MKTNSGKVSYLSHPTFLYHEWNKCYSEYRERKKECI